jgi:hypothetical protein
MPAAVFLPMRLNSDTPAGGAPGKPPLFAGDSTGANPLRQAVEKQPGSAAIDGCDDKASA